ncbi:MAG: hypothetical protein J6S91_13635 [Treponema sp.]|nr:hypothetical protein [Treponema sp.]
MSRRVIKYLVSLALLSLVLVVTIKFKGKVVQENNVSEQALSIIQEEDLGQEVQVPVEAIQDVQVEEEKPQEEIQENKAEEIKIDEDGSYTDKENVALYIHTYGKLPQNYISKKTAESLGWNSGEAVSTVAPGKSIGGDRFGNYEQLLPKKKGRQYYECDIDAYGKKSRGAKRIVFSNDGLIYYTDDHYESFELLYGE